MSEKRDIAVGDRVIAGNREGRVTGIAVGRYGDAERIKVAYEGLFFRRERWEFYFDVYLLVEAK